MLFKSFKDNPTKVKQTVKDVFNLNINKNFNFTVICGVGSYSFQILRYGFSNDKS